MSDKAIRTETGAPRSDREAVVKRNGQLVAS